MTRKTVVVSAVLGACLLGVHGVAYAQDATGSGTLIIVGTTYEFQVTGCDLGATQGPDGATLSGRGTTEGGVRFSVTAYRMTLNDLTHHGVSVYMLDGSGSLSALRVKLGSGGWTTSQGNVPDALIQIDGQRVRATGQFEDEDGELVGEGTLEAECR